MKGNPANLHTIKDLVDIAGHSWYPNDLQVFLRKPERHEVSFEEPFRSDSYWVALVSDDIGQNSLTIRLNSKEYVLGANDLLIIPPYALRQPSDGETRCGLACVAFTPDFLFETGLSQRHLDSFEYLNRSPCTHLHLSAADAARLMTVIRLLQEKNFTRDENPFAPEVVRHFFNVFQFELAGLYYKYTNQVRVVHDRKEELLWRFLNLLPVHAKTERSLQFYADQLYVTPKHLTQTVKKVSGKSAGKYINDLVIAEAKNLLRDPTLSIAQVADQLYFSDQFFFSKFFKRYTGVTPSDYRRRA